MPKNSINPIEQVDHYKDGSIKAKGQMANGELHGYWEWFRQDGSKLRSGHFEHGQPIDEWITYDRRGQVYKVTQRKKEE